MWSTLFRSLGFIWRVGTMHSLVAQVSVYICEAIADSACTASQLRAAKCYFFATSGDDIDEEITVAQGMCQVQVAVC